MEVNPFKNFFPFDSLRIIVEIGARLDNHTAFQLALVSKCFQAWCDLLLYTIDFTHGLLTVNRAELIMYEKISLRDHHERSRFLHSVKITNKPPSFYERSIKALFLPYTQACKHHKLCSNLACAYALLPICLGATRITCWITLRDRCDPQLAALIAQMRPTWLSARLKNLLAPGPPDFSAPFFSGITHIELVDDEWYKWSGFHHLPCLTHVRVRLPYGAYGAFVDEITHAVERFLERCPRLEICVLEFAWRGHGKKHLPLHQPIYPLSATQEDSRLVYILQNPVLRRDWEAVLSGQPDTWDFAEARATMQRELHCRLPACQVYDDDDSP